MQFENYQGYRIWGHAILEQADTQQPARDAASGTNTLRNRLIEHRLFSAISTQKRKPNLPASVGLARGSIAMAEQSRRRAEGDSRHCGPPRSSRRVVGVFVDLASGNAAPEQPTEQ